MLLAPALPLPAPAVLLCAADALLKAALGVLVEAGPPLLPYDSIAS